MKHDPIAKPGEAGIKALLAPGGLIYDLKGILPPAASHARSWAVGKTSPCKVALLNAADALAASLQLQFSTAVCLAHTSLKARNLLVIR